MSDFLFDHWFPTAQKNGQLSADDVAQLRSIRDRFADQLMAKDHAYEQARDADHLAEIKQAAQRTVTMFAFFVGISVTAYTEGPPSVGYEPWLLEHYVPPLPARGFARLTIRHGRRRAGDTNRRAEAVRAIRILAKSRYNRAARSRVDVLLRIWHDTSVFDELFKNQDPKAFAFVRLLESAAAGDEVAFHRLQIMAREHLPYLPDVRGRKLSAASAAHEFALEHLTGIIGPMPIRADGTDSLTEATRREFGLEHGSNFGIPETCNGAKCPVLRAYSRFSRMKCRDWTGWLATQC